MELKNHKKMNMISFFFAPYDPILILKIFKYNFPLNYMCFYEFPLT